MVGQGANMKPRKFGTFGPKALSGIHRLPGTLEDRSIPVQMKRKLRSEIVRRFRIREASEDATPIRDRLADWAAAAMGDLRDARPDVPDVLNDSAADSWEPLLAIADMSGGDRPGRSRIAALAR